MCQGFHNIIPGKSTCHSKSPPQITAVSISMRRGHTSVRPAFFLVVFSEEDTCSLSRIWSLSHPGSESCLGNKEVRLERGGHSPAPAPPESLWRPLWAICLKEDNLEGCASDWGGLRSRPGNVRSGGRESGVAWHPSERSCGRGVVRARAQTPVGTQVDHFSLIVRGLSQGGRSCLGPSATPDPGFA